MAAKTEGTHLDHTQKVQAVPLACRSQCPLIDVIPKDKCATATIGCISAFSHFRKRTESLQQLANGLSAWCVIDPGVTSHLLRDHDFFSRNNRVAR